MPGEDVADLHARMMRAAKDVRRHPSDENARAELERLRAALVEKRLENHIAKVVAAAPRLSDEQRDRLATLIRHADKRVDA